MNIEELDKALRQINANLISPKECQYIRFVGIRFSRIRITIDYS